MSSNNDILNVSPQIVTVPVGVTVGVYVGAIAGQRDVLVRNGGGGTCLILPSNAGSTYAGATLAALNATFSYTMGAAGAADGFVKLQGPASFYLAAIGSTATVYLLRGMSSGF